MEERLKINIEELRKLRNLDTFCADLAENKSLSEEAFRIVKRVLKNLTKLQSDYEGEDEKRKREREKIKYGL
ncbi:MAG: hypothetical protein LUH50_14230 [Bacteroides intestinalis]|nr:hypothetical protein [Bacteroides intestinalis]